MDEYEITSVLKDYNGNISHCCVKGYGIQNIEVIEKLIKEKTCSFFIRNGEKKMNVYAKTTTNGTKFLTTDASGSLTKGLDFLPLFDRPLLRQLIESVRWNVSLQVCHT